MKGYRGRSYIPNKFNATKVEVNGIEFASRKEAKRYKQLLEQEQAGEISGLRTQVSYELIPAQREPDTIGPKGGLKKGKVIERAVSYVADFVYQRGDELVVEDVKGYRGGDNAAYKVFVLKRKLMLYKYGIRVKEV